ncbi:hypothetical protein C0989_003917 [Termitomyces sp. Mn162]|nr:hypothetical protein C0989_003917 [Termitomyces sp. Mn162]
MSSHALAHKIGSLIFCPTCGTLLALPRDGEDAVTCEQCGHLEPASSYENTEITTRSHPDAFPSALQQKRKTQTKRHEKGDQGTLVSEKCPACGHLSAYSKEMQLRMRKLQARLARQQLVLVLVLSLNIHADRAEEGNNAKASEDAGGQSNGSLAGGDGVLGESVEELVTCSIVV